MRIVHWPFSMPPSINLKARLLSICYEAVSITNSSRLRRTWSTQNRSIVARPQTTAASRHAICAYMKLRRRTRNSARRDSLCNVARPHDPASSFRHSIHWPLTRGTRPRGVQSTVIERSLRPYHAHASSTSSASVGLDRVVQSRFARSDSP